MAAKLQAVASATPDRVKAALRKVGAQVAAESLKVTPLDEGSLRRSQVIHEPVVSGQDAYLLLSFGGTATPYALFVHEAPDGVNWQEPGTGPKYLENVISETRWQDELEAELAL